MFFIKIKTIYKKKQFKFIGKKLNRKHVKSQYHRMKLQIQILQAQDSSTIFYQNFLLDSIS